jgi:hypothetical protein
LLTSLYSNHPVAIDGTHFAIFQTLSSFENTNLKLRSEFPGSLTDFWWTTHPPQPESFFPESAAQGSYGGQRQKVDSDQARRSKNCQARVLARKSLPNCVRIMTPVPFPNLKLKTRRSTLELHPEIVGWAAGSSTFRFRCGFGG